MMTEVRHGLVYRLLGKLFSRLTSFCICYLLESILSLINVPLENVRL